jgi:hypothetical protein
MLGEPVELVVLGPSAEVVDARVLWRSDGSLGLAAGRPLPIGAPVCLRGLPPTDWLYGKVESSGEHGTVIAVRGAHASDRREFARSCGALRVRYQPVGRANVAAWLAGAPVEGTWLRPDPFMDFSGSGLKFHHGPFVSVGDALLVEISIGSSHRVHRMTARVVRVEEIPNDKRDETPWEEGAAIPTHAVAVHFDCVAPETTEALVRFGERIQEALLCV